MTKDRSARAPFWLSFLALLGTAGCAMTPADVQPVATPVCSFSESDRAWVNRALEAWRFSSREISGNTQLPPFQVIFFDDHCVLTSGNALSSPTVEGVTFTTSRHEGEVTLPDGNSLPVGVTSFSSGDKGTHFFVMSTPGVWEAGGVGEDSYFVEAEDVWLTFEGAGQWVAYQWLIHPDGGAEPPDEVMKKLNGNRWWSQTEGFAAVMTLDRIAGPGWKRHAFGDGAKTVLQMLDEAVAESPLGGKTPHKAGGSHLRLSASGHCDGPVSGRTLESGSSGARRKAKA